MHRTNRVLKWVAGGLLGVGLTHGAAPAQQPEPIAPAAQPRGKSNALVVSINGTKRLSMTPKRPIRTAVNEKDNIARIQPIVDDPGSILVVGLQAGTTKVTLTDANGVKEEIDVVVELDIDAVRAVLKRAVPTASVEPIPTGTNTIVLTGTVARVEDIETILRVAQGVLVSGVPTGGAGAGGAAGTTATVTIVNAMTVGGERQVQLDVTIASVNRTELRNFGTNFSVVGTTAYAGSLIGSLAAPGQQSGGGGGTGVTLLGPQAFLSALTPTSQSNLVFGIVPSNLNFFIQALKQEQLAKLLAEPKLVTKSGRPANFQSGGQQAVPEVTASGVGGGTVGARFEPFGTRLTYLPIVLGNGRILLDVDTEISNLNAANGFAIGGVIVSGRDVQAVRTVVEMEPGQTFAVGGLIQTEKAGTVNKTPIVGELPFVGPLFSQMNYRDRESELVILCTPFLVDAMDCRQAPCKLPGMETRSPDDFELFLELILEAPRGQREVFPYKKYKPAWMNDSTAGQFPCGGGTACGPNGTTGACATGTCAPKAVPAGVAGAPAMVPTVEASIPVLAPAEVPVTVIEDRATLPSPMPANQPGSPGGREP